MLNSDTMQALGAYRYSLATTLIVVQSVANGNRRQFLMDRAKELAVTYSQYPKHPMFETWQAQALSRELDIDNRGVKSLPYLGGILSEYARIQRHAVTLLPILEEHESRVARCYFGYDSVEPLELLAR